MKELFDSIKEIAPGIVYLHGFGGVIPCPSNADTASMLFIMRNGYTAGFTSLTQLEQTAVEELLDQQVIEFETVIKAKDFVVASPKVKENPKEALAEAIAEAKKSDGQNKSLALIILSLPHYLDDLEKRVDGLEKK